MQRHSQSIPRTEGAIAEVEAGKADTIVVAYFDRLVRSLRIQEEVLERVENAGGRVLAVDFGEVSGKRRHSGSRRPFSVPSTSTTARS